MNKEVNELIITRSKNKQNHTYTQKEEVAGGGGAKDVSPVQTDTKCKEETQTKRQHK